MMGLSVLFFLDPGIDLQNMLENLSVDGIQIEVSKERVRDIARFPNDRISVVITEDLPVLKKIIAYKNKYIKIIYTGMISSVTEYLEDIDGVWPDLKSLLNSKTEKINNEALEKDSNKTFSVGDEYEVLRTRLCNFVNDLKNRHLAWIYQNLLETTIDVVPDMFWLKRSDGIHMLVNDAFCEVVEKDKEEIKGKDHYYIWDVPRPEEGQKDYICVESEETVFEEGKTCVFDEHVQTKKGMKQLKTYKTPIYDFFGGYYGSIGIGHDVTNLSNLGLELSVLIENFPFPMFISDTDWHVIRMNTSFQRLVDINPDEDVDLLKRDVQNFDFKKWKDKIIIQSETKEVKDNVILKQDIIIDFKGVLKYYEYSEIKILDFFGNVTGYYVIMIDQTIRKAYEQDMLRMLNTDALTGIFNRRYCYDYLQNNMKSVYAMVYMDLDNFKMINDLYGHKEGDEVLVKTVKGIQSIFKDDIIIRMGGDEFIVLIEKEMTSKDIDSKINALNLYLSENCSTRDVKISISAGFKINNYEKLDIDGFIYDCDIKMYEMKKLHHKELTKKSIDNGSPKSFNYEEMFLRAFEKLYDVPRGDIPMVGNAIDELCETLRIGRSQITYYENMEDVRENRGKTTVFYNNSKKSPDEMRTFEKRNLTSGYNVAQYQFTQIVDEPDWSEKELGYIEKLSKLLYVFNGRQNLMNIAERLSFYDSDLRIPNLRYFLKRMEVLIENEEIYKYLAAFINLKRFSNVNKLVGNEEGTKIMRKYVEKLRSFLGEDGIIARVGGDNFALIADKSRYDDIIKAFKGLNIQFGMYKDEQVTVSARCGVYDINGEVEINNPNQVMDRISIAFQRTRVSARDVVIFNEKMFKEREKATRIEVGLQNALKHKEFVAYYQPKVNINNNTLSGAEALCRWVHGDVIITPDEFIPYLERGQDICELDYYMLDRVCSDIRRWLDEGKRVVRVSVNMSRRHFSNATFLEKIIEIIDKHNVPHEYIEVELTETTTDVLFKDLKRIVNGLYQHSVKTAVDDFGIGYSSLNLIRDIPWDVLKIDKSFLPVENDERKNEKMLVFNSVVQIAKGLGLECIVEGVETKEQLDLLYASKCEFVQGFYFDKPLPVEEFEQRLNQYMYNK